MAHLAPALGSQAPARLHVPAEVRIAAAGCPASMGEVRAADPWVDFDTEKVGKSWWGPNSVQLAYGCDKKKKWFMVKL